MSKKILAVVLVILSVFSLSATALAGPLIGMETTSIPAADMIDLVFGEGSITSKATAFGTPVINEYAKGDNNNTPNNPPKYIKEVTLTIGEEEYTAWGFEKSGNTQNIGVDLGANKTEVNAALADGYSVEAAFTMPASGIPFGNAIGGGFYLKSNGDKLTFYAGDTGAASGNYTLLAVDAPEVGEYVHFIANVDYENGFMQVFVNGVASERVAVSAFKAGGSRAAVGIGGNSTTTSYNYTDTVTPSGFICTALRMYSEPLTAKESQVAYIYHLAQELNLVEPVEEPETPEDPSASAIAPDVLDVTFGDGTVSATTSIASGVTAAEYSKSGTVASTSAIGNQTITIDGKDYTVKAFKKASTTNTVGVNFTKADLTAELAKGFTMETGFVVPEGLSGEMMFIGATTGGGVGIEHNGGNLIFLMHTGSGYAEVQTTMPAVGTYCHVLGVFDATAQKINLYLNGEFIGSAAAAKFNAGGYHGAIGIGASTASATNFTNFGVPADTILTDLNIYSLVAGEEDAKGLYNAHLKALGVEQTETPEEPEEPEVPVETTEKILEFNMGNEKFSALTCLESGVDASVYSKSETKTTAEAIKNLTVNINGKTLKTVGFVRDEGTNSVGFAFDKAELTEAFTDGFAIETSFVVPSGLSGEMHFVGGTNGGGPAIYYYNDELVFCMGNAGGGYAEVGVDMPEVGSYVHVVGNYDAVNKTIQIIVNGVPSSKVAVAGYRAGDSFGAIGLGGCTASAENFTKYITPSGTVLTGLTIHNDPLTEEELTNAYSDHIAQFGLVATPEYEKDYTDEFEPVVRFMVTSDTHIISETDGRAVKTGHAIRDAYALSLNSGNHYEKLDLVAIAGDISDNGKPAELQAVKSVLDANVQDGTELLLTLGNHEYYTSYEEAQATFTQYLGEEARSHKVINGYHFIAVTVDVNGYQYSADQQNWLRQELAKAEAEGGKDKPIFVIQHIPQKDTVLGSDTDWWASSANTTLNAIYTQYPQAVVFAGHSHMPINDEASIIQTGYTMLNTGTLKLGDTSADERGAQVPLGDGGSQWDVSQVYIVEVAANNNTRIRMYDITADKFVGETYMLDGYTVEDFDYTASRFDLEDSAIFWEDDAKINILNTTSNLISFEFPTVSEESFTTRVFKAVVKNKATGEEVASRYVGWQYWNENYDTIISSGIGGLEPGTEYVLEIYGVNSKFRVMVDQDCIVSANPLTAEFSTIAVPTGDPVADILDVKIDKDADGNAVITDISDCDDFTLTSTIGGTPLVKYDETIGMNTVTFEGNEEWVKLANYGTYANSMAYSMTVEGYFKVNEWNIADYSKAIFASQQSGGFGFNMTDYDEETDKGTIQFEIYNGSYKNITKTVETGKYYHYVAVYDGQTVTYFVNGSKIAKVECAAPLFIQDTTGRVVYLGADTTGPGNPERQSRTSIALARIYSLPLTDEQVKGLWEEVEALRDDEVYPDDFSSDPEYLFWEAIDDEDDRYVSFEDTEGNVHDHADDNNSAPDTMVNGEIQCFSGSHLFDSQSHAITGDVMCKLNFTGTAFRYVLYYRGPADGYGTGVDIYIDGVYHGTADDINGNNLTSKYIAYEVTGLDDKAHEITFVSSTGARVMMDCFEVVFGDGSDENGTDIPEIPIWTTVDVTEYNYIQYYTNNGELCDLSSLDSFGELDATEQWQFFNDASLQNKTGIYGNYIQDAYFTLNFEGTGIRYITSYRGPKTADIDIYIDGELVTTVTDLSADNIASAYKVFEVTGLEEGKHTFMAVNKNGGQMPIDYLQVVGQPLEPSEMVEPEDPEQPGDPTDPEQPGGPTDPEDPEDPTDPEDPEDPTDPEDPEDPTDPEDPNEDDLIEDEPEEDDLIEDEPSEEPAEDEEEETDKDSPATADSTMLVFVILSVVISLSFGITLFIKKRESISK